MGARPRLKKFFRREASRETDCPSIDGTTELQQWIERLVDGAKRANDEMKGIAVIR